uniref:LRAT domain-containing protein n=1 Tax=Steinernema glaseri TaxID=37863 RepID=A0A1I7Z892_9BILA
MGMVPNELTSRWLSGEELAPFLELGDLVEFRQLAPFLELGDLVEFRRVLRERHHVYAHWAIYIGLIDEKHRVIHLSNGESDFGVDLDVMPKAALTAKLTNQNQVTVRGDEFLLVADGDLCRINNSLDRVIKPFPPPIVRERAVQSLGKGDYSVFLNNCEHFAKWARYGSAESNQATLAKSVILGSAALAVTGSIPAGLTATVCGLGLSYLSKRARRYFSFIPQVFR